MPLVPAKCPECGGNINVDVDKRAAICEFCKQPFVVEDAINNFNTTYNITNNNEIKADVVNVYENSKNDYEIYGGFLNKYCGEALNIIIPGNVKVVSSNAFGGLLIESLDVSSSVREIGKQAFEKCVDLKRVILGNSIENIGDKAFANCHSLQEIILPSGISVLGSGAFYECTSLKTIDLPNGIKTIYENSFAKCSQLKCISLPDGLEVIKERAFEGCISLTEIRIPASVTTIKADAFKDCKALERVVILGEVPNIEMGAFSNCKALVDVQADTEMIARNIKLFAETPFRFKLCRELKICPECFKPLSPYGNCKEYGCINYGKIVK